MIVIVQKMDCLCRHFFVVVVVRKEIHRMSTQRKSTSSNAAQVLARVRQCFVFVIEVLRVKPQGKENKNFALPSPPFLF